MIGNLTIFESPGPLAKVWALSAEGLPEKSTAAQMTRGTYRVTEFSDVHGLAALLTGVTTHQAVSSSLPFDGSTAGKVVTQAASADNPDALTRTKKHFPLLVGPGVGFIDCDQGGISRDALKDMLIDAIPALAEAGMCWRPSGSSHIFHGDNDLTGLKGHHVAVMVQDASDWPRVLKVAARRLWIAGHGSIALSSAGSLLKRCPIDLAVGEPARLMFVGGGICKSPLEQRRGPAVILSEGGFLDTRALVPDLTHQEEDLYESLVERAEAAAMPKALQVRAEHKAKTISRRLPQMMAGGISAAEAETRISQAVDAIYGGALLPDAELTVVHNDGTCEVITVGHALEHPERYHLKDCRDPLNPSHRGGAPDCRLYLLQARPIAYSLDDGGRTYQLRREPVRLQLVRGSRSELVERLANVIAANDSVFATYAGPVILKGGRTVPLTVERLMNLAGSNVTLFTRDAKGKDTPVDLPKEIASLTLVALST